MVSQHALQGGCLLPGGPVWGDAWSGGVSAPGGCLLPGGVPAPRGGAWSRGGACLETPQKQTATVADSTHPTGMHSWYELKYSLWMGPSIWSPRLCYIRLDSSISLLRLSFKKTNNQNNITRNYYFPHEQQIISCNKFIFGLQVKKVITKRLSSVNQSLLVYLKRCFIKESNQISIQVSTHLYGKIGISSGQVFCQVVRFDEWPEILIWTLFRN